jgi:tetratricopeptide (TPR) repeat protein
MNDRSDKLAAEKCFATAQMLHRQGRLAEAEEQYRTAVALDGGHYDAAEWLGALCLQIGKSDEAIHWLGEAAAQRPEKAVYQDNLAAALMQAQRPQEAAAAYRRSLAVAPDAIETRINLANLLRQMGHYDEAMAEFEKAVALDPHLKTVCRDPATLCTEEARCNTVLDNCRHILARYPNYAPAHYSMACTLLNLGRVAEARRASERAIALNPTVPVYYHILIHSAEPDQNASAVSALEKMTEHEAALPEAGRAMLHFLLAKAYDDQMRYEEAFAHLQKANATKRPTIVYDEAREIGRMSAIAAAFTPERIEELRGSGHPSAAPVFILGMPRSGTTLVEQILASHPEVHGAGELTYLSELVREGQAGNDFPAGFATLTPDRLRRLGEAYAARLFAMAPGAQRITDKQPYNFLYVGLIHLALPDARIIHVKRDPLDTCFSCFSLMFGGDVGFAYDLGELGRYYKAYEALMAHWRSVLSERALLEVQYEDLVKDLPGHARRIVEYCGLKWNKRCLQFHKSTRAVTTASLVQVRLPVYKSSVGRAQAYADHLGPLCDALGLPRESETE